MLDETQTLDGEGVLPGLAISLMDVFKVLNGPDNALDNALDDQSGKGTAE